MMWNDDENFLRFFNVAGMRYAAIVRPSQYKKGWGTPDFFIQLWKMEGDTSGKLYMPEIIGWRKPSVQGYAVRTMNIEVEYSRFIEDFKEYEKVFLGLPLPKSFRY